VVFRRCLLRQLYFLMIYKKYCLLADAPLSSLTVRLTKYTPASVGLPLILQLIIFRVLSLEISLFGLGPSTVALLHLPKLTPLGRFAAVTERESLMSTSVPVTLKPYSLPTIATGTTSAIIFGA